MEEVKRVITPRLAHTNPCMQFPASAASVGSSGKVVGLDLNAGMLTKAREFSLSESGVPIEWREGDAATLPFDDSTFDLVLCSQGLQYFPDRNAALREMR